MATLGDFMSQDVKNQMDNSGGADDSDIVIENPNVKTKTDVNGNVVVDDGSAEEDVLVIENPNVKMTKEEIKNAPVNEFSGNIDLNNPDNIVSIEDIKPAESKKPKRIAADLSKLPKDKPDGSENVHTSLEDDILGKGGPFEKYLQRKTKEMMEINELIDQHNAMVAAERGVEVPSDEELEEMGERGEATNNLTAVLKGTKYYDQADEYGRGIGELKGSPLDKRIENDPALKEELYGTEVEKTATDSVPENLNVNEEEEEYIDDMEREIEEEINATTVEENENILEEDSSVEKEDIVEEEPVKESPVTKPEVKISVKPAPEETKTEDTRGIINTEKDLPSEKPAVDDIESELDDIEPDDDDAPTGDIISSIQEVDEEEDMKGFQAEISKKIKPVKQKINLSSFRVIKTPVSLSAATLQPKDRTAMDWMLPHSNMHISMREFTGKEMEQIVNNDSGANRYQTLKNRYKLIYEHITSPKNDDLESWLKNVSFQDADHLMFAAYGAGFTGSYFVPYDCSKCKHTFLSDNFPLSSLYKFKDDEAKERCMKLITSQDGVEPGSYVTEAIQISDNFAISFRDPSLWNAFFETSILDEKFINKYQSILSVIMYIDEIWQIGDGTIAPIGYKIDTSNQVKTVKARAITYAKILSSLSSDQYNLVMAHLNAINSRQEDVTFIRPEVTCPNCGTVIPEAESSGEEYLFTRSQLAVLSLTSIS